MAYDKHEVSISGYVGLPEIARERYYGKTQLDRIWQGLTDRFDLKEEVMSDLDYRLNGAPYDSGINNPFYNPLNNKTTTNTNSDVFLEFVVARLLEDLRAGRIEIERISLDPYYEGDVLTGWDYDATINRSYEQLREEFIGQTGGESAQRVCFEILNCETEDIGLDSRSRIENGFEEGEFVDDLLAKRDAAFTQAASDAGVTPEVFAEVLRQLPEYKGGLTDVETDYGADYSAVIDDVVDYLSDDRHARS